MGSSPIPDRMSDRNATSLRLVIGDLWFANQFTHHKSQIINRDVTAIARVIGGICETTKSGLLRPVGSFAPRGRAVSLGAAPGCQGRAGRLRPPSPQRDEHRGTEKV